MRHDVIIYMRFISFDVVVPEQYVWEFMRDYGEEFKVTDSYSGVTSKKPVEGYYEHPTSWHIQVKVFEEDEQRFHEFLRKFSLERNLSFRDPDIQTKIT